MPWHQTPFFLWERRKIPCLTLRSGNYKKGIGFFLVGNYTKGTGVFARRFINSMWASVCVGVWRAPHKDSIDFFPRSMWGYHASLLLNKTVCTPVSHKYLAVLSKTKSASIVAVSHDILFISNFTDHTQVPWEIRKKIQGDFWLGYHLFDCCVSWIAHIKMDQFSLGPVLLTRGSRWFFIHSRDNRRWGGESDMVIDGCKVILIVWWWMFGRTLTEADTWDKASHSCNRPATVSTPGNGAAPDDTHKQGGGGQHRGERETTEM